ncbi:MAG: hypothetical protein ACLPY1_11735 [Terracidiphilus sp.]
MYEQVVPADRQPLKEGVQRYTRDQMKRNWSDLFEIRIPGYAIDTDYDDLSGNAPILSKKDFVDALDERVSNGSLPFMQSFDLVSVTPVKGGYEVRGCSKAQRESFHFKGIVKFMAYVSDGKFRFGSWMFVYSMPHSCSQTADSE